VRSTTASLFSCYRPVAATPLTLGRAPDILECVKDRLMPLVTVLLFVGPQTRGDSNVDGWAVTAP
jgi:hypothetical protein